MNQLEDQVTHRPVESVRPIIHVEDVLGDSAEDRTLIYGYTVERYTFHVYLQGGKLHRYVYTSDGTLLDYSSRYQFFADEMVPSKRSFPEECDYQFVFQLRKLGVYHNPTNWAPQDKRTKPLRTVNGVPVKRADWIDPA